MLQLDNTYLKTETELFNFQDPQVDPVALAADLKEGLTRLNGLGLAANQVGLNLRVFAFGDPKDPEMQMVMFNPEIITVYGEPTFAEEGCLSFPDLVLKVKRYDDLRIRFQNEKGDVVVNRFRGLTARVVQHEVDHLGGVTFDRRANRLHLEQARKHMAKLHKQRQKVKVAKAEKSADVA